MRLLLAEDDLNLRAVLARGLREEGYVVDTVANGTEAIDYLRIYEYAVCVLDWRMPGASGLDVVTWARGRGIQTPFLMLTARDAPPDRVHALDEGADDYLVKPFDYPELLARLRALLRRPSGDRSPLLRCGLLTVDPATHQAFVAGERADLTPREFAIIELLVRRSPAVVPRRSIVLQAWPEEASGVGSNTIDVHIARLRGKLARSDARIETLPRDWLPTDWPVAMTTPTGRHDSSARQVRTHVHRVALGATLLALVLYLLACFIVDLVVVDRLNREVDSRLAARLHQVIPTMPPAGAAGTLGSYSPKSSGDFDDAPIVLWWVPAEAEHAVRLDKNSPGLPAAALHVGRPTEFTVGGLEFRLAGAGLADGRLIAGTTAEQVRSALSTLLVIEAILGPLALVILYGAASVIGRSAAAPVERARRRQLEFTADASHELRTPLSVIEAEVGLALNVKRSAPEYRRALEQIAGESKRLRHIVEDLLWLARLDSLPSAPPIGAVDVASLVSVCADRFRVIGDRRGITISVTENGASPPIVFAPAEWLDRLVSVLLDNACRYASDKGRVDVTVSAEGDRVVLVVDDSGPGILEADREHIFQRFHRASAVPGGAGLGLSIADAVVRATGGNCTVTTAPLGGARITVSWPRHRPEHAWTTADDAGPQEDAGGLVYARRAPRTEHEPLGESERKIKQK